MTYRRQFSNYLLRNTIFNSFGRVVGLFIAFLLTPFVLSRLGREYFGIWALTTALLSYVQLLDLGLGASFVKYVAEHAAQGNHDEINKIISTGFFALGALSVILGGLAILAAPTVVGLFQINSHLLPTAIAVWRLTLVIFLIDYTFSLFNAVIQGLQRMDMTNAIAIGSACFQAVMTVVILGGGGGLIQWTLGRLFVECVTACALLLATQHLLPSLRVRLADTSMGTLRKLAHYGSRIQVARFAELGITQVDKIALGAFVGLGAVSAYELGSRVVMSLKYLAGITTSALVPAASELQARDDRVLFLELYERSSKYLVLVAAPTMAFAVITAPALTLAWLGEVNSAAVRVVQVLAVGAFIHLLTGSGTMLARGIGRPELEASYTVLLLVLNFVLSLLLIWHLGFTGALMATPIALLIASSFFLIQFHRQIVGDHLVHFAWRVWAWPVGIALLAGLATWLMPRPFQMQGLALRLQAFVDLGLKGALFIGLFSVLIFPSPYLDSADRRLLRRLLAAVRARLHLFLAPA
ncbi:MAG TPA: hypothetical protein DEP84_31655 [Chloroflexi bacterium]|nr:hypothetical protein [Chloroflexota bacterium]